MQIKSTIPFTVPKVVKSILRFLLEIVILTVLHLGSKQFKRIENKTVTTAEL